MRSHLVAVVIVGTEEPFSVIAVFHCGAAHLVYLRLSLFRFFVIPFYSAHFYVFGADKAEHTRDHYGFRHLAVTRVPVFGRGEGLEGLSRFIGEAA